MVERGEWSSTSLSVCLLDSRKETSHWTCDRPIVGHHSTTGRHWKSAAERSPLSLACTGRLAAISAAALLMVAHSWATRGDELCPLAWSTHKVPNCKEVPPAALADCFFFLASKTATIQTRWCPVMSEVPNLVGRTWRAGTGSFLS